MLVSRLFAVLVALTLTLASCGGGVSPQPNPSPVPVPTPTPTLSYRVVPSAVSVLLTPQQPSYALSAQVFDAQGNAVNNAQVVWESSKPASIEVNANGIVTARNFSDAATVRARVGSVYSDAIPVSTADLNNAVLVTKVDFSSITSVNPTTLRLVSSDSSKVYSVGQKLVFQDDEIAGKITSASRDTSNRWVLSLVNVPLNEVFSGGVLIGRNSNPSGAVASSQAVQDTRQTFAITPQSLAAMGISDPSSQCRTENNSAVTFKIAWTLFNVSLDNSKISADSARFDLGRRSLYFKINTDLNGTVDLGTFEVEGKAPEGKITCVFPLPAVFGWSGSIPYIGSMEVGIVPSVSVELTTSPGNLKVRYAKAKYVLKKSFSVGMHYENGREVGDVNSQSGPGFENVPGEWGASFDFAQTKLEVKLALSLAGKVNVFKQDYGGSLAEASGYGNLAVSLASADISGFNPFWNSPDLGMSSVIFPKIQGDLGLKIEAGNILKPLADRINDTTRFWGFTLANPEVTLLDVKTPWLSPPSLTLEVANDPSCPSGKRLNTMFKPGVGMAGADTIQEIVYLARQRDVSPNFALLGRNKLTSGNTSTLCWQSPSSTRPSVSWEVRSVALSSVFVQRFVSSPLSLDTTSSAGCGVAAVTVTPTNLQLNVGQTQTLSARVDLNPPNCPNPPSTTLTWTSGDSSKVTVDSSGKVTGVAATGQPVIVTASAGGKSGSSSVSVSGPATQACVVQSVTVSPSTVQLQVGQTAQLTAIPNIGPTGCSGTPNTSVSWSSSDSSRAAVSSTGIATGVAPTTTPVTLTATIGGKSASSSATVTAVPQVQYTYLIDALNNLCLTVSGASSADNAPVLALACQAGDNRRYTLKATSDYVQVVAKHSGKCFGLSGSTAQEGARVVQVTCDGGSVAQRFTPVREASGLLKLVSKVNGMCVDVMMPFNVVSGEVGLFGCHAGNNQRYRDPVDLGSAPTCVVQSVTVTPASLQLEVGKTAQLSATPNIGPVGCSGTPNTAVSWSSSDSSKVSVTLSGGVSGVSSTSSYVTIKATIGSVNGLSNVEVISKNSFENSQFKLVSAGDNYSLAIKNDATLWAWGLNDHGQLGNGNGITQYSPIKVLDNVLQTSAGTDHSLAIKTDKTLWSWGFNNFGQLGNGSTSVSYFPINIMSDVIKISAGCSYSAAVKSDGTLWVWGNNSYGKLGNGNTYNAYSPIKIMSNVTDVSIGCTHSMALKTDGSLWSWGNNSSGQLGDGTKTQKYTPVQVMTGVKNVSSGGNCSMALKNDGTLWTWGNNDAGQLGNGNKDSISLPNQIMSGVKFIGPSGCTLAIKNDSSLWSWGNTSQTSILDSVSSVSNSSHILAVKLDGSIWSWGDNGHGQLGRSVGLGSNLPGKLP